MPPPLSAGVLLFRTRDGATEVLLIRPGGPYWKKRRSGAWMIPKGGIEPGEQPADAAVREFREELGSNLPAPPAWLCRIRQSGGKQVEVFAVEGDFDPAAMTSMEFEMEWPPRSGLLQRFPECEEARWMALPDARRMMLPSQLPILDCLERKLNAGRQPSHARD